MVDHGGGVGQWLHAGGVHRVHLFHGIEEAIELGQHALALRVGQLQTRQIGDASDVGQGQGHGWTRFR
ncbi:hypothetical protein D9M69_610660 [compost metagenome]